MSKKKKKKLKLKSVSDLTSLLYRQIEDMHNGKDFDYKRAKAVARTTSTALSSHRVNMQALKLVNSTEEIRKLPGLLKKKKN